MNRVSVVFAPVETLLLVPRLVLLLLLRHEVVEDLAVLLEVE